MTPKPQAIVGSVQVPQKWEHHVVQINEIDLMNIVGAGGRIGLQIPDSADGSGEATENWEIVTVTQHPRKVLGMTVYHAWLKRPVL